MEKTGSKVFWGASLIIVVLVLVSLAGMLLSRFSQDSTASESQWKIIRPPGEVAVFAEQGEVMWAGGMDGVYQLDLIKKEFVRELGNFNHVKALLADDDGRLWIGHEKGITIYDGSFQAEYTKDQGLPDNHITSLIKDRQGRIWAGTWQGAAIFDGKSWQVMDRKHDLLSDMVNVIAEDDQGGIWIGSYDAPRGGLTYLRGETRQYFTVESGLPHNNINAVVSADDGTVWVGTGYLDRGGAVQFIRDEAGIWRIDQLIAQEQGLPGAKVRSLYQDKTGLIWYGMEYDGLVCRKNNVWQRFTGENGLSGNEVKVMWEDEGGYLWLGTENGITVAEREKILD